MKLSVMIITRNEEKNIRDCLETVKWADEIVIVDQSSTDNTVQLCRNYTDKIFITEPKGYCEPDRAFAAGKTGGDWVLYLDADERVSPQLRDEISNIVKNGGEFKCWYVTRKNHFLGKWIKTCGWYPGYVLRLFRKGTVVFTTAIHKDGSTGERCGYLKNDLIHYSYVSLEDYFEKFNRYTTQLAKEAYRKGFRINRLNFAGCFLLKPAAVFLRKYLLQAGWRDGVAGFFISISSAVVIFVTYSKLWEMQNVPEGAVCQ